MKDNRISLVLCLLLLVLSTTSKVSSHSKNESIRPRNHREARKLEAEDYLPDFDELSPEVDEEVAKTLHDRAIKKKQKKQQKRQKQGKMANQMPPMQPSRLESYMHGPMQNPFLNFGMPFNPLISPIQSAPVVKRKKKQKMKKKARKMKTQLDCKNVQAEAINIANQIMKRQNKDIFKNIMDYVLKSKYLVGVTEIKLVKTLEKKIKKLMSEFSDFSSTNVNFTEDDFTDINSSNCDDMLNEMGPDVDEILENKVIH